MSHFWFELFAVAAVVRQTPRAMEDRQLAIGIFVDAYRRFDVVAAMAVGRDLQELSLVDDAVIGAHGALFLEA